MKTVKCKKYGISPTKIETESLTSDVFRIKYNIYRLTKVKKDAGRQSGSDRNQDTRNRKKLRDLLKIGDLVLSLPKTLKKRCAWKTLQKYNRKQVTFFNRDQIFVIKRRIRGKRDGSFTGSRRKTMRR